MRTIPYTREFFPRLMRFASPAILAFLLGTSAMAQKEATIHNFKRGTDGALPTSSLIADSAGNMYGTTSEGGGSTNCVSGKTTIGCGTVYELTPPSSGVKTWTETILYAFQGGKTDGASPNASLVFDASGNLYGTTNTDGQSNMGVIFKLSPPKKSGGAWTETVLYNFAAQQPTGGLVFDSAGNIYGESTVPEIYELSPPSAPASTWTFTTLRKFTSQDGGLNPIGGLAIDKSGHLYGTSSTGGIDAKAGCPVSTCGLVFELEKSTSGTWEEHVLYNFTGQNGDGASPQAGVIFRGGILYGTTINGGDGTGDGTVFELSPGTGSWTETTLYAFSAKAGHSPEAGVVFDHNGNLYSTLYDGLNSGAGEVFELSPPTGGGSPWTFTDLFDFDCGSTGCNLNSSLIFDKTTVLYGTSTNNGPGKFGLVFSVTP